MTKELVQKEIDELKQIVIDLHRSAGSLDVIIQHLETTLSEKDEDSKFWKAYIQAERDYRRSKKETLSYDRLEEREDDVWYKLLKAIKD